MAGMEGFEPPNARTKTWCLTAWPIPNTYDCHARTGEDCTKKRYILPEPNKLRSLNHKWYHNCSKYI